MLTILLFATLIIFGSIYFTEEKFQPIKEEFQVQSTVQTSEKIQKAKEESNTKTPAKIKELQKQLNIEPKNNRAIPKNSKVFSEKIREKSKKETKTGLNLSYTIQVLHTDKRNIAEEKLAELRQYELNAFITPDYSNPEKKNYLVCLDIFESETHANHAINQIKNLNITGKLKPKKLEYSLQVPNSEFDITNIYQFTIYSDKTHKKYFFAGAFPNFITADLFRRVNPSFHKYIIIKR